MKTNTQISMAHLNSTFYCFEDVDHLRNELLLYIRNDCRLLTDLHKDRRVKTHSIAYRALWLIAENERIKEGYYISSPQMQKFIKERFAMDYKELLAPLLPILEEERNEVLGFKK